MKRLVYLLLFVGLFSQAQLVDRFTPFPQDLCTADPNELNTTANPTSDPNCNEANSQGDWLQSGFVTRSVETVDVDNGEFAQRITSDDGGTGYGYLPISVTNGDALDIVIRVKLDVGTANTANFFLSGVGVSNNGSQNLDGTLQEITFSTTVSSTGSMQMRFYPARSSGTGVTGNSILVYSISVIKTN